MKYQLKPTFHTSINMHEEKTLPVYTHYSLKIQLIFMVTKYIRIRLIEVVGLLLYELYENRDANIILILHSRPIIRD